MQQQTQNVANPMQVGSPAIQPAAVAAAESARKQRHGAPVGTTSGQVMAVANPAANQLMDTGKTQNKTMWVSMN